MGPGLASSTKFQLMCVCVVFVVVFVVVVLHVFLSAKFIQRNFFIIVNYPTS